jgi:hypothetical protein
VAFLALALAQSNGTARLLQNVTKDARFEVTLVFYTWHLPETFQNEENARSCYSFNDSTRD